MSRSSRRSTGTTEEDSLGGGGPQRSWGALKQAAHANSNERFFLRSSFQAETLNRKGSKVLETLVSRSII